MYIFPHDLLASLSGLINFVHCCFWIFLDLLFYLLFLPWAKKMFLFWPVFFFVSVVGVAVANLAIWMPDTLGHERCKLIIFFCFTSFSHFAESKIYLSFRYRGPWKATEVGLISCRRCGNWLGCCCCLACW